MKKTYRCLAQLLALGLLAASADGAVICARKGTGTSAAEGAALKVRSACKRKEVAIDVVEDESITTDKLAAEAVTGEKIADGTITAGKIVDGTLTALKIKDGEVVKGGGFMFVNRVVLTDGAIDTPILTFDGIGLLQASCAAGTATTSFVNDAGTAINLQASGTQRNLAGDTAFVNRTNPSNGAVSALPNIGVGGIQSIEWQASFTDANNKVHAVTAWATMGASTTNCIVTAQGLTTN